MSVTGVRIPQLTRPGALAGDVGPSTLLAILLGGMGAAYVAVALPQAYRITLAVAIGVNLIVLGMKWPRTAAMATLLFLPFVALIRRLLISSVDYTSNDPLILIGPVVAMFLFYRLYILEGRRLTSDLVSKLVLGMVAMGLVQVLNPFGQGTVVTNLGGLIFLTVPLLWFFIGRAAADEGSIAFLLQAFVAVAVIVGVYGMFQTEWSPGQHLPSWDQQWFDQAGYAALTVQAGIANNAVRAFSTFPSNQEYATFLAISLVIIFAMAVHRRFWGLVLVPLLAAAMFYAGGRSPMALALLAIVILTGIRTRKASLAAVVIVLGIGAIFGIAALAGPRLDEAAGVSNNVVASHNIQGLLHPLDPEGSGVARWGNFFSGISEGFANPAGKGTGASNAGGGGRLSNDSKGTKDTDNDISDVFASYGAVGGVLFILLIVMTYRAVFRRYVRTRDWRAFATMGVLICMFGNWLNGGYYTLAPFLWLLAGWATRPDLEVEAEGEPDHEAVTEHARPQALASA